MTMTKQTRMTLDSVAALEQRYHGLRREAGRLQREELAFWRGIERLMRGVRGRLTTVEHKPGRKDKITHGRLGRGGGDSLVAVARQRGSSGLLCGCSPIRIMPQPNGDIDVCVLIACSNDPATSGFRCEYWCGTLEAEPVVSIARRTGRRRRKAKK
jgi:hypothetical protein